MKKIKIQKEKGSKKIARIVKPDFLVEVMDRLETDACLNETQGRVVNFMGYSFLDQQGNVVEDLRAKGYNEIMKKQERDDGAVYNFGKPEYQENENMVVCDIECINSKTKKNYWGTGTAKKWGKYNDIFARQIALTKATRNAIKPHCDFDLVNKMFILWKKAGKIITGKVENGKVMIDVPTGENGKVETKAFEIPAEKEKTMGDNQKVTAERAFYAQVNKINEKWKTQMDAEKVKKYFKNIYKVAHLKDLPVEDIKKICNDLYYIGLAETKTMDLLNAIKEIK